ncbi:hypothetical protein ACFVMC_00305 [Nocardia sp. NPDC127579]|uniref:hypothetical protein n=1 Tax=Nocardia sp. NPDC127579 TaxID=3345402 RepID=UPI003628E4C9
MGTACWSQRIQDPDVVAELAKQPEPDRPIPPAIEGFGTLEAALAAITDRLAQVVFATVRADPNAAPSSPRPEYPHLELREQLRRAPLIEMEQQLTGGE